MALRNKISKILNIHPFSFIICKLNDAGYSADTYAITITGVDAENVETPVSNAISITVQQYINQCGYISDGYSAVTVNVSDRIGISRSVQQ